MLVIFRFESFLHGLSQTLAVGLAFRVVLPIKVYAGADALCQIVTENPIDMVLTAMVGYAGLKPTIIITTELEKPERASSGVRI